MDFMARAYDRFMAATEEACLGNWRSELLAGLQGEVLEVGAGTGANLQYYPETVSKLILSEPELAMRKRMRRKVEDQQHAAQQVEIAAALSHSLPYDTSRFDALVSTLVLCSVPDVSATLAEARRVLKPGGKLVFIEHVCDEQRVGRRLLQYAVQPAWRRVVGGCHLTRRTEQLIEQAGFSVEQIKRESMRKALPIVRTSIRGVASAPLA